MSAGPGGDSSDEDLWAPRRGTGGNAVAAGARPMERLSFPAIRQRRLSRAVVRGLSGAEPLDRLRPVCRRRMAARFLAGSAGAGGRRGVDHIADAAGVRPARPPIGAARHRDRARRDDLAAVARRHSAHRHFRGHRGAGAAPPAVRSGLIEPARVCRVGAAGRLCRRHPQCDARGADGDRGRGRPGAALSARPAAAAGARTRRRRPGARGRHAAGHQLRAVAASSPGRRAAMASCSRG